MAAPTPQTNLPTDEATTGQKSYRYLRLSLAMIVAALFISITVEVVTAGIAGHQTLPSISHYFYTPAHNVFVASLIAASLALAVLAGRDLETVFLDIAAVFSPLIALVPTGITDGLFKDITGSHTTTPMSNCDSNANCVPSSYVDAIHNGVATYSIVVGIAVVLIVIVRAKRFRELWPSQTTAGLRARLWLSAFGSAAIAAIVAVVMLLSTFVAPVNVNFPFNTWLPLSVHFAATILFFGSFTAVPIINALRYRALRRGASLAPGESEITKFQGIVYHIVPVAMVLDIIAVIIVVKLDPPGSWVLICEALALALFAWFWIVQTVQRWHEVNPPSFM